MQCVELLNEDPKIFKEFKFWLYTGQLSSTFNFGKLERTGDKRVAFPQAVRQMWLDLVDMYIFADRSLGPTIHNTIIEAFINAKQVQSNVSLDFLVPKIYGNLTAGSKLRDLMLDYAVAYGIDYVPLSGKEAGNALTAVNEYLIEAHQKTYPLFESSRKIKVLPSTQPQSYFI